MSVCRTTSACGAISASRRKGHCLSLYATRAWLSYLTHDLLPSRSGCASLASGKGHFMRSVGIVALNVMLGGCASVTRGTTENISIASTPSGVEAVVSGMEVPTTCTTPCSVVIKRNADISITFQKEGYDRQIVPLSPDIPTSGA